MSGSSCLPTIALTSSYRQPLLHLPFPGTYIPQKEVEVVEIIQATIVRQNQALRLRARKECWDRDGKERVTGRGPRSTDGGWGAGVLPAEK